MAKSKKKENLKSTKITTKRHLWSSSSKLSAFLSTETFHTRRKKHNTYKYKQTNKQKIPPTKNITPDSLLLIFERTMSNWYIKKKKQELSTYFDYGIGAKNFWYDITKELISKTLKIFISLIEFISMHKFSLFH